MSRLIVQVKVHQKYFPLVHHPVCEVSEADTEVQQPLSQREEVRWLYIGSITRVILLLDLEHLDVFTVDIEHEWNDIKNIFHF